MVLLNLTDADSLGMISVGDILCLSMSSISTPIGPTDYHTDSYPTQEQLQTSENEPTMCCDVLGDDINGTPDSPKCQPTKCQFP